MDHLLYCLGEINWIKQKACIRGRQASLILIFVLLGLSIGCNLEEIKPAATISPSSTPLPPSKTPTSSATPTVTGTATAIPTATPLPEFFKEEFDNNLDSWSYFVTGNEKDTDIRTGNGRLTFNIKQKQTYAYLTYTGRHYENASIAVQADNVGEKNSSFVGVICRYSEKGWYEFNMSSNGYYFIYRVTKSGGKATFKKLMGGASQSIIMGKATNHYTAICNGNKLQLIINSKGLKPVTDSTFSEGLIGLSVSTVNIWPVTVDFDWISVNKP